MRSEKKQEEANPAEEKLEDLHVTDEQAEETKAGPVTRLIFGHDQGIWQTESNNSLASKN